MSTSLQSRRYLLFLNPNDKVKISIARRQKIVKLKLTLQSVHS